jgi:hypothetical protein
MIWHFLSKKIKNFIDPLSSRSNGDMTWMAEHLPGGYTMKRIKMPGHWYIIARRKNEK